VNYPFKQVLATVLLLSLYVVDLKLINIGRKLQNVRGHTTCQIP